MQGPQNHSHSPGTNLKRRYTQRFLHAPTHKLRNLANGSENPTTFRGCEVDPLMVDGAFMSGVVPLTSRYSHIRAVSMQTLLIESKP